MEWTAVSGIAGACSFVVGTMTAGATYFFTRGVRETGVATKADAAHIVATLTAGKLDLLETDFHRHQTETAASIAALRAQVDAAASTQSTIERRVFDAVESIGNRVDRGFAELTQRVDRLLEGQKTARRGA